MISLCELFGVRIMTGEAVTPPKPDNDNWHLAPDGRTPAELLQIIRRWKLQAHRELAADPKLWNCAEHRLTRSHYYAIEACALWHYYGGR
jgi:hypothetical protein